MPHFVPISPQWRMNFSSTGVSPVLRVSAMLLLLKYSIIQSFLLQQNIPYILVVCQAVSPAPNSALSPPGTVATPVMLSTAVRVEVRLLRFRKFPFTCSQPSFRSHSGLVAVGYLFGFIFFTD